MFLSVEHFASQFLSCFLISRAATGRRRLYNARNTLFLAAAGFATLEIHYFRPPQVLQCPKYTISDCRRLCNARNTLFPVAASFATPEIHYFWLSQTLQCPKYTISGRRRFVWLRNTLFPPPPCPPGMEKRPPDTVSERSLFKENGRR